MNDLITLQQATNDLRCEPDDPSVPDLISDASEAVLNYLAEHADYFLDSAGSVIVDSAGNPLGVPRVVQRATRLQVVEWYEHRKPTPNDPVPAEYGYGYLSRAVVALLFPLRTPSLG